MTAIASETFAAQRANPATAAAPDDIWRRALRSRRVMIGGAILLAIMLVCLLTMPLTLSSRSGLFFDRQSADPGQVRLAPTALHGLTAFGTDALGRSLLSRCLLGGAISLGIGLAAAAISLVLGVTVGLIAGYKGGWIDATLMRFVDVMYGLPYVLLVILFKIALESPLSTGLAHLLPTSVNSRSAANLIVLFLAIGLVSWLTMARVVRGQVLTLRTQPFIEACKAGGLTEWRIFTRHLLPNLVGPITVYATLTVPSAILQESFLSFLGIGIQPPMPTWGGLASEGLLPALNTFNSYWWLLFFPCVLLAVTLLSLNFLGDGLRDIFDPKREAAKI